MSEKAETNQVSRRSFIKAASIASGVAAIGTQPIIAQDQEKESEATESEFEQSEIRGIPQLKNRNEIKTNVAKALTQPKSRYSMPGLFPGKVTEVYHPGAMDGRKPNEEIAAKMLAEGMKDLTGAKDARDAWAQFIDPKEKIGIKVNPVGGRQIGTTLAMTKAVVAALENIGVPRSNMIFWEHYDMGLDRWGMNEKNFPGIKYTTFHYMVDKDGKKVPGEMDRLDMDYYYEADYYLSDEKNEMEYMQNNGPKSYFPKVITQEVDKIINIPTLKHHICSFIVVAMKNLSYGATTNCVRGHNFIDRYIAETCAFPAIRDKTVLNICDGLRAQYDKGPGFNAQASWVANKVLLATDPVSMDKICFDHIFDKRVEVGMCKEDERELYYKEYDFMSIAENLGLGIFRSKEIEHNKITLG